MIALEKGAKIYIQCPAATATGGPEALHQLGHYLIKNGFDAQMSYIPPNHPIPIHPQYEAYSVPYAEEVENDAKNVMILAESNLYPIYQKPYSKIRKAIWWLSVTYYWEGLKPWKENIQKKPFYVLKSLVNPHINPPLPTLERLRKLPLDHIRHSFYSEVFLKENNIRVTGKISDYMNQAFINEIDNNCIKEDIILYNPKKNDAFLHDLIKQTPQFNWVAVQGLLASEVAALMNKSKVYIDFGFHPGKERMPREACLMNCCMIIGRNGSAAYQEDMPIRNEYRFNKDVSLYPDIADLISDCLANYHVRIKDFAEYKEELLTEEAVFNKDINAVFTHK